MSVQSAKTAVTDVPINTTLAERWSPRAFDPDHVLDDETLTALLEAARWAPSSGNSQPWRFVIGRRGDDVHGRLFATLADGNKSWAGAASVLMLAVTEATHDDGTARSHASYDTGTAIGQLVTEAGHRDLHVHQMAGFSVEAVAASLGIDAPFKPLTMIAIGRRTTPDVLGERLAARETAPRERLALSEIAFAEWQIPLSL